MKKIHDSYRPDIDGIRAIAIVSVILFHAFPEIFSGGFIGVDIFFVISGYLISCIIFKKFESGDFSYINFYVRRIKRIFPALAVVLIGCMLIGWFVFLSDEYVNLGRHVLAGVGFISNLMLWREVGYFDTAAELKPLLHLWSLGVEEQYYIVWPILVAIIWRRGRNFLLIVIPILIFSFVLNIWLVNERAAAAFFLPVTRFWELMVGSSLAFFVMHEQPWSKVMRTYAYANMLSVCGFLLVVLGVFVINKDVAFPGWWALMPTIGTFMLIYAGSGAWVNSFVLGNRVLVYVGLISYPLYLWHWPLLVFGQLMDINQMIFGKFLLVTIAVILAILTYHLIEIPIRKNSNREGFVAIKLSVTMLFVGVLGFGLVYLIKPMHSNQELEKIVSAANEWDYPGRLKKLSFGGRRILHEGDLEAKSILFIGDSNIEQYYPRAETLLNKYQKLFNLVFITTGGCPPIPNVKAHSHPNCSGFVDAALAYAARPEVKTVVVGAQWFGYLSGHGDYYYENKTLPLTIGSQGYQAALFSLKGLLSGLIKQGKQVYIIGNIPIGIELDPKAMINRSIFNDQFIVINKNEGIPRMKLMNSYGQIVGDLRGVADASGAKYISPIDYLCDEINCRSVDSNGNPIYRDGNHLRSSFVRSDLFFLDAIFN